jgi:hypothetical protein
MRTISALRIKRFLFPASHLSDGWEADESNRRHTGSRYIEAHTATTSPTTARWCGNKLASKFCELRLELPQMIARGFILLGLNHLA